MKKFGMSVSALVLAAALLLPASLLAQKEEKDKEQKETKEKKDVQQIIITRKGDNTEKVVVEINGDKITINGKPLEEYKDKNGDLSVHLNKMKDYAMTWTPKAGSGPFTFNGDNFSFFSEDANRAMLGVTTDKVEEGVEVQSVTKESAAEKAGLKEKDIITKIDETKIEDPDGLADAVKKHKPGDKVTVTYLRDKKEQKATAELSKWKGLNSFNQSFPLENFKMDLGDMNINPPTRMRVPSQNWSWSSGGPKMGLSVQDTDDGKGVKVIEVDSESNASKAGVKEEDIITEIDGKAVNSADEVAKIIRDSKDKPSVMMKVLRGGKAQNIEVKIPRKLKTADL